jgi:hypothetical protein
MTAGAILVGKTFPAMIDDGKVATGVLNIVMAVFVISCVTALLLLALARWVAVAKGVVPVRTEPPTDRAVVPPEPEVAVDGVTLGERTQFFPK